MWQDMKHCVFRTIADTDQRNHEKTFMVLFMINRKNGGRRLTEREKAQKNWRKTGC